MQKLLSFGAGLFVGAVVTALLLNWIAVGGIRPPSPQEPPVKYLTFSKLEDGDAWLEKVHPILVPLPEIRSVRKYAMLIFEPPPEGIPVSFGTRAFNLDNGAVVQPILISSRDFGPKGDQVAVKFIDEGGVIWELYSQNLSTPLLYPIPNPDR